MKITEKLLFVYIALIPLMRVTPFRSINKIEYSDLVFAVLFLLWSAEVIGGKRALRKAELVWPLFFMLSVFFLSAICSGRLLYSGIEFAGIFYLACMYFLTVQLASSEGIWWGLVKTWVAISSALALTAIGAYFLSFFGIETFLLDNYDMLGFASHGLVHRAISIFKHPAMFATYLHVSIIFGFILAARAALKKRNSFWIYLSIILCLCAVLLTKTRDIAGIMLSIFLILTVFPLKNWVVMIAKYLSFLSATALIVCVFFMTVWWILPVTISRVPGTNNIRIELNFTHQSYFVHHKASFNMMREHPLLGVGPGMYNYKSGKYITWEEARGPYRVIYPNLTEGEETAYKRGIDPHSTYLGWGAETGLTGLLAILGFFFSAGYILFKKIGMEKDAVRKYVYGIMLAGIAGFLFDGFYIDILTMRHFWFLIAMAMALLSLKKSAPDKISEGLPAG